MTRQIRVASIQFQTRAQTGQPDAGKIILQETQASLDALREVPLDLVVLSESIEAVAQTLETAESLDRPGPFLQMYMDFAASHKCVVAGSTKLVEHGRVYNAIAYIGPEGYPLGAYHKVNLTSSEIDEGLASGKGAVVVDTPIGRLGGVICFDLNFKELREQYHSLKLDILTFSSMYHGGFIQKIWAYECQSFFVSSLPYHDTAIIDPFGQRLGSTDEYNPVAHATINLDHEIVHLDFNGEKFSDIRKAYGDQVRIEIPAHIGSAMIYSESNQRSAADIVREFELQPLDDYFTRAQQKNNANRYESNGQN